MKIFMLAGEASGDALGAPLIKSLRKSNQDIDIIGIGGPGMIEAGLESLLPIEELNIMGIWEILSQLPRLLRLINGVVEEVEKHNPDIYLGIDFPDFNFEVAKRLKKRGIYKGKIYHYVAPTVWAWRPGRAKAVAQFLDGLFCLFPFEPDYFTPHGLKAWYVGHPLIEHNPEAYDGAAFRRMMGIDPDVSVCGLFFGSRPSEVQSMSKAIVESAIYLSERIEDIEFLVPTLPYLEMDVRNTLQDLSAPYHITVSDEHKYASFRACDAAVAVSGTVGLELAYLGTPHAIGYKTNPVNYFMVKSLAQTKYIHLANMLLQEPAIPELIQFDFTAEKMADVIEPFLSDNSENRSNQLKYFEKLQIKLKEGIATNPSDKAASVLLSHVNVE